MNCSNVALLLLLLFGLGNHYSVKLKAPQDCIYVVITADVYYVSSVDFMELKLKTINHSFSLKLICRDLAEG